MTSPSAVSGYALTSPSSSIPSSPALSRSNSISTGLYMQGRSSHFNTVALPTRQLNPASLFARLGLPGSSTTPALSGGMAIPSMKYKQRHQPEEGGSEDDNIQDMDGIHTTIQGPSSNPMTLTSSSSTSSAADDLAGIPASSTTVPTISPSHSTLIPIAADILLPFADRPAEIKELLEQESRNRDLYDLLKDTFAIKVSFSHGPSSPSPNSSRYGHSSQPLSQLMTTNTPNRKNSDSTVTAISPGSAVNTKWNWEDVETHLEASRESLPDQEWIDILKSQVYPRSHLLWERLRACLGVDVDDERGGDRYEALSSDIVVQPEPDGIVSPNVQLSPRAILQQQQQNNNVSSREGVALPDASVVPLSRNSIEHPNPFSPPISTAATLGGGGSSSMESSSSSFSPSGAGFFGKDGSRSSSHASIHDSGGSGSKSPARNHRRTSSGGSNFRRSFAMSSINEEKPTERFDDNASESDTEEPYLPMTDSNNSSWSNSPKTQESSARNSWQAHDSREKVEMGSLLRLKGHSVDPGIPSVESSSASAAGTTTSSGTLNSLGLHIGASGPVLGSANSLPRRETIGNTSATRQARRNSYRDFVSVFGSEEESQSVSGSIRSRGQGPGVSFSFYTCPSSN